MLVLAAEQRKTIIRATSLCHALLHLVAMCSGGLSQGVADGAGGGGNLAAASHVAARL